MPTFEEFLPFIAVGGAAVLITGLIPPIGPGRALWIAMKSRFAFKPVPESLRFSESQIIKEILAPKRKGQQYLVVTGERGVGKTCLVNTATSKTPGVIKMKVYPRDHQRLIVRKTLVHLANLPFTFIPPFHSAKRVIWWFRLFTLGQSPIIVMNATERKVGEPFADIAGAARTLVDDHNLNVVVVGTPNSLDESIFKTTRQIILEINPMSKEMIWQIPQLQNLFDCVKKAGLENTTFAVLGGIPSRYDQLDQICEMQIKTDQDAREVIGRFLCSEIYGAMDIVMNSEMRTNDMSEIIKLFDKENNCILKKTLNQRKLERPSPDKVFREVKKNGVSVLIPASNAIGIVLKHGIEEEPSLSELEELVKSNV